MPELSSAPKRPPPVEAISRVGPVGRPLSGLTALVVEDSRFACEAIRLLCLRSGARIRRADSLAAARRHLAIYRPEVVIVDLGLPDGPGEALIADLARSRARPPALIAISGDPGLGASALGAGADAFLEKPVRSLAAFQRLILKLVPPAADDFRGPRMLEQCAAVLPVPDRMALHDDLMRAAALLGEAPDAAMRAYLAQFLGGLARSAGDPALAEAARGLHQGGRHWPDPGSAARANDPAIRIAGPGAAADARAPVGPGTDGPLPARRPQAAGRSQGGALPDAVARLARLVQRRLDAARDDPLQLAAPRGGPVVGITHRKAPRLL